EVVDIPEERVTFPHRGERVLHTVKVPLKDERGDPLYLLCMIDDITEKKAAEEVRQKEHLFQETQREFGGFIQALFTPVIPVHECILVVPLVGRMDEARGAQLMEVLLTGIQRHRAIAALIDITGVPVIDADVAKDLVNATRAAA